jgi:drug/metabolite transporter superfamily protein YnfA
MKFIKKRLKQVVIEGSRHSKEVNRVAKIALYIGPPIILLMVIPFLLGYAAERTAGLVFASLGGLLVVFLGAISAYHYDKGYRQRDIITDEDFAGLGYKVVPPAYLISITFLLYFLIQLNKHVLHWF